MVENYRPHEIGTPMLMLMPDGTKYAGTSPETNKPMFTTPADAPVPYSWTTGFQYCADLDAGGHKDWRMPSKDELNVLFQNRAAIGGFNKTGPHGAQWYWSSSPYYSSGAWTQRFRDGYQFYGNRYGEPMSLRCVR